MQHNFYRDLYIEDGYEAFDFFSIGKRGIAPKRIAFIPTDQEAVYNLVFGDINAEGEIDDEVISDNGDRNKILATVIYVVNTYLEAYPERIVFFTGSTEGRIRLYRIVISVHYTDFSKKFDIYCQTETGIVPFKRNIEAKGFLICKKV
ncbi:hypothetical protein [Chitinophaga sp. CF418]|uniref:DUF6934 family protein n=1 Tax=Chitinophaga sp. CF418 TaxID=1855287 RepID=UPI00091281B9|nr:hypothetical protein [Chitinophaga sp. CF418]SHN12461.1 hypothetical protein SAMN05216311_105308 [Chitinophaga sp. CF418]